MHALGQELLHPSLILPQPAINACPLQYPELVESPASRLLCSGRARVNSSIRSAAICITHVMRHLIHHFLRIGHPALPYAARPTKNAPKRLAHPMRQLLNLIVKCLHMLRW